MSSELLPGGADSIAQGCTCTVRDGERQDNEKWPQWLVRGCPLHDPEVKAGVKQSGTEKAGE